MRYKNKWEGGKLNKKYWKEVLEGKIIKKVKFSKTGVSEIHLDNGEILYMSEVAPFHIKEAG